MLGRGLPVQREGTDRDLELGVHPILAPLDGDATITMNVANGISNQVVPRLAEEADLPASA